jgi:hypothetical protein
VRFVARNLIILISQTFFAGNHNKRARISGLLHSYSTTDFERCAKGHLRPLKLAAATIVHPHNTTMGNVKNGYRNILLHGLILVWHIVHHINIIEHVDRR